MAGWRAQRAQARPAHRYSRALTPPLQPMWPPSFSTNSWAETRA